MYQIVYESCKYKLNYTLYCEYCKWGKKLLIIYSILHFMSEFTLILTQRKCYSPFEVFIWPIHVI